MPLHRRGGILASLLPSANNDIDSVHARLRVAPCISSLEQRNPNHGLRPSPSASWPCKESFWPMALVHLCVVYAYLHTAMAELSGCGREDKGPQPKIFNLWAFTETIC